MDSVYFECSPLTMATAEAVAKTQAETGVAMVTVDARAVSSISGATLEKAKRVRAGRVRVGRVRAGRIHVNTVCAPLQELGEVPERRLDNIAELREKIAEAEQRAEFRGMVFARRDDRFLLRFLRARKFQVERALQLYLNYYKYRHKHAHHLGELSLQSVEHVLQRDFFALLDTPTNSGSKMLVVFPSRWVT